MKRKFKKAGIESYKKTGDEEYPHSYTLVIDQNKLIPGLTLHNYHTALQKSRIQVTSCSLA